MHWKAALCAITIFCLLACLPVVSSSSLHQQDALENGPVAAPKKLKHHGLDPDVATATKKLKHRALEGQYRKMLDRMSVLTPDELVLHIEQASREFGVDANELTGLISQGTQWGALQSFEYLFTELYQRRIRVFASGYGITLADVLMYLARKAPAEINRILQDRVLTNKNSNALFCQTESSRGVTLADGEESCAYLLDNVSLALLESDERLLKQLQELLDEDKIRLVVPSGYINGINAFTHLTAERRIFNLAKAFADARSDSCDYECAADVALDGPVRASITSLFSEEVLTRKVIWIQTTPQEMGPVSPTSVEGVAVNLMPRVPSWESYKEAISLVSECGEEDDIADTLNNHGMFFSMANLSQISRKIMDHIKSSSFEPQYYVVPTAERAKSFSMAGMIFAMANEEEISPAVFVDQNWLEEHFKAAHSAWHDGCMDAMETGIGCDKDQEPTPARVVVVDDVAGSGDSLMSVRASLMHQHSIEDVRVAPFVLSERAEVLFRKQGFALYHGEKAYPLSLREKKKWMGTPGFSYGIFFIVFPYMAPDNNCLFVSFFVAPLFTFLGGGVKNRAKPPGIECGPASTSLAQLTIVALRRMDRATQHEAEEWRPSFSPLSSELISGINAEPDCFAYITNEFRLVNPYAMDTSHTLDELKMAHKEDDDKDKPKWSCVKNAAIMMQQHLPPLWISVNGPDHV